MIPTDKLYNLIIPIHTLSANVCKTAEALGSSGSFRSSGRSGTEPKSKLGSKWTWLMPAFASWRRWRSPTVPSWKLRKAPSICKLPISSNHWMSWVISKLQLSPKWYICIFWIILESVLRPGIFFSKVQHKTISTRGVFTHSSHLKVPVHLFEGQIFALPLGIHRLVHGAEISHMQLIDGGVLGCHLAQKVLKVLWPRIFSGHLSIEAAHEPWKKDEKRTLYIFISQPQILVGHGRAIPETRSHPRLCAMTKLRHLGLLWTSPWGSQGDFHPDPWWHWRYCDRFLVPWYLLDCPGISTDLNSLASPGFGQGGSSQMRLRPASAEQAMEYLSDTQPTLGLSTPPEAGWQVSLSSIYLDFLLELLWFCHKCCHLPFHSFTAVYTTWNDHWNHQNWVVQCLILTWKSLWRPLTWQIIEMFCSQKLLEN